jgi:electron transport complex protein RnfB
MMADILIAVLITAGIGMLLAIVLVVAGRFFAVEVDPTVKAVLENLPGANCGGCGSAGYAAEICASDTTEFKCPVCSPEAVQAIGAILGRELGAAGGSKVAFVRCGGSCDKAQQKFEYQGVQDCKAAQLVAGGAKTCGFGCLGLGSCVTACKFGAITIGANGLPLVKLENCVACGACVEACPRGIIELVDKEAKIMVNCVSKDKPKPTKDSCQVGCIKCKICVKNCPAEAIVVEGGAAVIDQAKCTACGVCVEKCPTGAIVVRLAN